MKEAIRLKHMFYVLRYLLVINKIKMILLFGRQEKRAVGVAETK